MVIDVEGAVVDYLTTNMDSVVGTGNNTIGIYRRKFPDDGQAEGVSVYAELREGHESVYELEPCGIRIQVRTHSAKHSFYLAQNVDDLLDRVVQKNLNSTVKMCVCRRNSGPTPYSDDNGLEYCTALYVMTVRWRGNDA